SVPRKLDDERAMLRISPRKPGSAWSRVNKARVERLVAEGRMTPAGMEKVEAAKRDGSWAALDQVEAMVMPPDLDAALGADPAARANFDAFPPGSRKIILGWIAAAKRAETRAGRVAETVRLAHDNVRANHWRKP
ncbi:MAG: YdeI/OmpD-associated family protein, partial [Gemmatimonadetes bacterium]|nr:YdeI/OmpD-associated family protein [Gemmatimonadota bacterium]